jgi:phage N-6-adenine-methyltransferase
VNDERRTPPEVFDPLHAIFGFELDPCTTEDNPLKLPRFYTPKQDGLTQPWNGKSFVNCGYSRGEIAKWIEKCRFEAKERNTFSFLLIPNDTSTAWWRTAKALSWGHYKFPFRIRFMLADGSRDHPAKFPSIGFLIGGMP